MANTESFGHNRHIVVTAKAPPNVCSWLKPSFLSGCLKRILEMALFFFSKPLKLLQCDTTLYCP